jgi:phosphonate transport system substrate-binding protein
MRRLVSWLSSNQNFGAIRGAVIVAALIMSLAGCTKTEDDVYVMGFVPSENAQTVTVNAKKLTDLLTSQTGVKLKSYVSSDYTGLIEAMKGGHVQFAWLGPFGLVLAEKQAGAKVLLKCVRFGRSTFYSAIIVRTDSPYKNIKDLKGKTIGWADPASSSGYIVPKASLINDGIDPDRFFGRQIFTGGHDTVVLGVINKSIDAGATFTNEPDAQTGAWTMLAAMRPEYKKMIRAVYVTKPIPNDVVATTDKFYADHKDVVDKVTAALEKLHETTEGRKSLDEIYKIEKLIPAESAEFESLRKAADKLNLDVEKKK